MRLRTRICLAGLVIAIVAALPSAALGVSQTVVIRSFAFGPVNTIITAGDSVTWQNADPATHTATSDAGAFDTGPIAAGATSTAIPFASAGTYAYHCAIHPSMKGTITVQGAATPVPPSPTPAPTVPPTPAPTLPRTPPPTAVPTASPTAAPSPSPAPSASAAPTPTPSTTPLPPPTQISRSNPDPTAAAPGGSGPIPGSGPGPLLAATAVGLAAALAALAIYLYRRR